jgi:hypothetical protein
MVQDLFRRGWAVMEKGKDFSRKLE